MLSFRWFGETDPVSLNYIRQIPGMKGIATALYDVPVGISWPLDKVVALRDTVREHGFELSAIESVPVHEDIKLGRPTRDTYIENFNETLRNLAQAHIPTICYNFMPVFDWTRSSLEFYLSDGSTALAYQEEVVARMNPLSGDMKLPGWNAGYENHEVQALLEAYNEVGEEQLWENLSYFLKEVVPVAEEVGVKLAIHPDDPPWSIFGLPRIIKDQESLERVTQIHDSPSNGLCICSGSLGVNPNNDLPDLLRYFGQRGKVNFVHARNVKITDEKSFYESAHLSSEGDVDMYEMMCAMSDVDYDGPIRPDHGRMIWGEQGKPGYGLYDRALGAVYLNGLWEAIQKSRRTR